MATNYDMIVIGAGPIGCAAAIEAARLGLGVVLIDSPRDQGEETHVASMWEQVLAGAALRIPTVRGADPQSGAPSPRQKEILRGITIGQTAAVEAYVETLRRRAYEQGVHLKVGDACFEAPDRVRLRPNDVVEASIVIVATNSRPRRPRRFPFDDSVVCDCESILHMERQARNVVVIGAEENGCEFSCLFASLGASVTLVDRRSRHLRYVDRDILRVLHDRMEKLGIDIALQEEIKSVELEQHRWEPHAVVSLGSGRVEKCDRVLIVAGRLADIERHRPDRAGIETNPRGFITTDDFAKTTHEGIYAVGGAADWKGGIGTQMYRARVSVLHAIGRVPDFEEYFPISLFTMPELSMVGLTDEACERLDMSYTIGLARYSDTLQGRLQAEQEGLLKLVVDQESGRLLGIHHVGSMASELMNFGLALLRRNATVDDVASGVYQVPSLAELYRVAADDARRGVRWR